VRWSSTEEWYAAVAVPKRKPQCIATSTRPVQHTGAATRFFRNVKVPIDRRCPVFVHPGGCESSSIRQGTLKVVTSSKGLDESRNFPI